MTLAKQLCIEGGLMRQRRYIEEALRVESLKNAGNPSCHYIGVLYPQNVKYFEEQGYKVKVLSAADSTRAGITLPLNWIYPDPELFQLSDEELQRAENSLRSDDDPDGEPDVENTILSW